MKTITFNVPSKADADELGAEENYTAEVDGATIYFDSIEHTGGGYLFSKNGVDTAFVPENECVVSPEVSMRRAGETPNEAVPFADE